MMDKHMYYDTLNRITQAFDEGLNIHKKHNGEEIVSIQHSNFSKILSAISDTITFIRSSDFVSYVYASETPVEASEIEDNETPAGSITDVTGGQIDLVIDAKGEVK